MEECLPYHFFLNLKLQDIFLLNNQMRIPISNLRGIGNNIIRIKQQRAIWLIIYEILD